MARFRFARLLWFVLLTSAFSVFGLNYAGAEERLASWYDPGAEGRPTGNGVPYDPSGYTATSSIPPLETELGVSDEEYPVATAPADELYLFVTGHSLDLAQQPEEPPGLTNASLDEAEDRRPLAGQDLLYEVASQEIGSLQETPRQPNLPEREAQQPASTQGVAQDEANVGVYLVEPGDTLSGLASRFGTSVDNLMRSNGIADPNVIYSGQALRLHPNSIDSINPDFISRQEGFRLDGYVPDPLFSRSGVTVGTGVDIGQLSIADIEALAIPQTLKQKLVPYAGLIRQDAVNFLNNHPLHIAEDEASILDGAIAQKTINDLAYRYNAAASGESFTELPPEVQTALTDIAYQYGSNLGQQMPNFWSDLTQGRWESVIHKLRNFGDRYPTRRNAEGDLLQGAIERGELRDYVV